MPIRLVSAELIIGQLDPIDRTPLQRSDRVICFRVRDRHGQHVSNFDALYRVDTLCRWLCLRELTLTEGCWIPCPEHNRWIPLTATQQARVHEAHLHYAHQGNENSYYTQRMEWHDERREREHGLWIRISATCIRISTRWLEWVVDMGRFARERVGDSRKISPHSTLLNCQRQCTVTHIHHHKA
jgi:hypothetical protein